MPGTWGGKNPPGHGQLANRGNRLGGTSLWGLFAFHAPLACFGSSLPSPFLRRFRALVSYCAVLRDNNTLTS